MMAVGALASPAAPHRPSPPVVRPSAAAATAAAAKKAAVVATNIFDMTRMCKFFAKGRCSKGQDCTFAHSKDQLLPQPDFYKTQWCADFVRTGVCPIGPKCTYAHRSEELRTPNVPKMREPCALAAPGPIHRGARPVPDDVCEQLLRTQRQVNELQAKLEAVMALSVSQATGVVRPVANLGLAPLAGAPGAAFILSTPSPQAGYPAPAPVPVSPSFGMAFCKAKVDEEDADVCQGFRFSRQSTEEDAGNAAQHPMDSEDSDDEWSEYDFGSGGTSLDEVSEPALGKGAEQQAPAPERAAAEMQEAGWFLSDQVQRMAAASGLRLLIRGTFVDVEASSHAAASAPLRRRAHSLPAPARP